MKSEDLNCTGEFCDFRQALDLLPSSSSASKQRGKGVPSSRAVHDYKYVIDRESRRREERDAAVRLIRRVLTTSEMHRLEESGKLIQLRSATASATAATGDSSFQRINYRSIDLARCEHRLALSRLSTAEEEGYSTTTGHQSRSYSLEAESTNCEHVLQKEITGRTCIPSQEVTDDSSRDKGILVCGVCAGVYNLLDQARNLLEQGVDEEEKNPHIPYNRMSSTAKVRCKESRAPIMLDTENNYYLPRNRVKALNERSGVPKKDDISEVRRGQAPIKDSLAAKDSKEKKVVKDLTEVPRKSLKPFTGKRLVAKQQIKTMPSKSSERKHPLSSKILICDASKDYAEEVRVHCASAGYLAHAATSKEEGVKYLEMVSYDAVIFGSCEYFGGLVDVMKMIRSRKRQKVVAVSGKERLPIIVLTSGDESENTLRTFLRFHITHYLGRPLDVVKFLEVIKGAVPYGAANSSRKKKRVLQPKPKFSEETSCSVQTNGKVLSERREKLTNNLISSEAMSTQLISSLPKVDRGRISATMELDSQTSFPYTVLNHSQHDLDSKRKRNSSFNLVICHDLFDTQERLELLLKPIASRYCNIQVLLWNYPGQAYTKFRSDEHLNNEFHSKCLTELIHHVGEEGRKEFNSTHPCYLMGVGSGALVALYFAARGRALNLRGLLLFNGSAFVDAHYASVLHDCRNVFSCSPPSRPDLPLYFYSRFIFSSTYLKKTTAPLALNLYTAICNPISLKGRMQLCVGALNHVDVRPMLNDIFAPIISVHGDEAGLIKPIHSQHFVNARSGKCAPSIHHALKGRRHNTMVIWMKGGHELLQEQKQKSLTLIEQLLLGYHEVNVSNTRPNATSDISCAPPTNLFNVQLGKPKGLSEGKQLEDRFVDTVMENMKSKLNILKETGQSAPENADNESNKEQWARFQSSNAEELPNSNATINKSHYMSQPTWKERRTNDSALCVKSNAKGEEKRDNELYKEYPEVKEYMAWRVKRNKKRLTRLGLNAIIVQRAYRAHLARLLVKLAKRQRASLEIQRIFRGRSGRRYFLEKKKEMWGIKFTQRSLRGFLGRSKFMRRRRRVDSQIIISRVWRGFVARRFVAYLIHRRNNAATQIECLWRKRKSRKVTFLRRLRRYASISIQRVCRGHIGRNEAERERNKYIFVKSQSGGIELGRQMLMEHKLHATKLQSEVSILNQEKAKNEEAADELLDEISQFEDNVQLLESKMHRLSLRETDTAANLDAVTRNELKNQKMQIDKEFSTMLAKISDRRNRLQVMEAKMERLERDRQSKDQELRDLERKLVILLETQQKELDQIRRAQESRGETLVGNNNAIVPVSSSGQGYCGPTMKEKQQAAQLMESTEAMMKFGFMSMSMTYFSSMNMVKAMKNVGVQDTVMAAISQKNNETANEAGIANYSPKSLDAAACAPSQIMVRRWSVNDVQEWLSTLCLSQYRDAFREGAIDGSFLYALTDEDLRNTLGVEHRLHRKKILFNIEKLRNSMKPTTTNDSSVFIDGRTSEEVTAGGINESGSQNYVSFEAPITPVQSSFSDVARASSLKLSNAKLHDLKPKAKDTPEPVPRIDINDLFSWVRHQKIDTVRRALQHLPNKRFDGADIRVQHVDDYGTAYTNSYDQQLFHPNQVDDYGNTVLHVAAQNGFIRIAKLLIQKGANPNHQNRQGQTPGHFAMAYQFYDLGSWLFEPNGGGANDMLLNIYDLSPYDGLAIEG